MKTIKTFHNGKRENSNRIFFVTSDHRSKFKSHFGKNDQKTIYTFPVDFFKKHFKYERRTGIYRTDLTCKDVWQYGITYNN